MRVNARVQSCRLHSRTIGVLAALVALAGAVTVAEAETIYVEKSGADSSTCGTAASPCLTITGTDGAFAKVTANNDNGFATCNDDHNQGCGQCDPNGTAARNTACNEDADCGTGGTCTSFACNLAASDAGEACLIDGDCNGGSGGTCSGWDSDRCTTGACFGPTKVYAVQFGTGRWTESLSASDDGQIPSPGFVDLVGVGQDSVIWGTTNNCTVDLTDRKAVGLINMNLTNVGTSGKALCSTGNATQNIFIETLFAIVGASAYPIHFSGRGNITNGFLDSRIFSIGGVTSGNGIYFESWGSSCTNDRTIGCSPFEGLPAGCGTCDINFSHDFAWVGGRIQPSGGASGPTASGGTAIDIVGMACGSPFNIIIDGVPVHGANVGGGANLRKGLVVRMGTCAAASTNDPNLHVVVRNLDLTGTSTLTGFSPFDVAVEVGSDATLDVLGSLSYDACTRVIDGTLRYANSGEFGGGLSHLGVLADCSAPVSPVDGETWYDATNDVLEGQVNGSIVDLTSTDGAIKKVKGADETRTNDAVITADDDLVVDALELAVNTTYLVEGTIFYQSHANPDFKFAVSWPTTGSPDARIGVDVVQTGGTFKEYEVMTGSGTELNHSTSTSQTYTANIRGTLFVGTATTGGFDFGWAQKSSKSDATTVLKGSWIRLTKE